MNDKRLVVIGVQARSTSKRFPNKISQKIAGRTMLEWVLSSCENAVRYLKNDCKSLNAEVQMALLMPKGDPVATVYRGHLTIIEGDENDVLSRYVTLAKGLGAHGVVRITADCPLIPTHLIAKHVKSFLIKERDYTTNVLVRSYKEGFDTEVISARLLQWLDENAKGVDREHVTSLVGPGKPFPFKDAYGKPSVCHILNQFNESEERTSIDTPEDLEKIRKMVSELEDRKMITSRQGIFVT